MTNKKPPFKRRFFIIIPDKPFRTIEEQIQLLKDKNIIINNEERARKILENVSYYTLINGYKSTFVVDQDEKYVDDISMDELLFIHMMDLDIHTIILKYILYIEKSLKSKISYLVSEKYGVISSTSSNRVDVLGDYLYEKNYSNSGRRRLNTLIKLKNDIINCRCYTTTHYYLKEKNHVPPWILVNDIPLGRALEWYKIFKAEDKHTISKQMIDFNNSLSDEDRTFLLIKFISLLRDYRNKIAHGNRTFSSLVSTRLPKVHLFKLLGEKLISAQEFDRGLGERDFYAVIITISSLINDPIVFRLFINDITNIILKYKDYQYSSAKLSFFDIFNIPDDIDTRLGNLFRRRMISK